jgi:hypothetical protein
MHYRLIHRSAWKMNSRKFAVTSEATIWAEAAAYVGAQCPVWIEALWKTFVSRDCYEPLRLATAQLPKNFQQEAPTLAERRTAVPCPSIGGGHEMFGACIKLRLGE